ncbi:hypothetical protein Tco_0183394, partial [Tanacetum coccineum]
ISSISIGSSDVQPSESPYLPVLFIGTSQSRHHDKSESIPPGLWRIIGNLYLTIPSLSLRNEHEVLASVNIFLCPKSGVHPWIGPVDLEFLDAIVQCFINLLQSAITELVYFIEPRDHLNPVSISKDGCPWRVYDGEIMLELKSSGSHRGLVRFSYVCNSHSKVGNSSTR